MSDIFISYAHEDAATVERLAAALRNAGYSSWWDKNLSSGSRYLKETEAELKAATAVLVVWSKASVDSHWVADEAAVGRDNGRLVTVTFDGSMPPLGFRQFQVTDFGRWKDGAEEAPFQSLMAGLSRLAKPSGEALVGPRISNVGDIRTILRRPLVLGTIAFVGAVVLAVLGFMTGRPQAAAPPTSQRTAFFGFTTTSTDPVAVQMATSATEETFKTLTALGLETASQAETQSVSIHGQLERAKELGALYVLAGEVKTTGDGYAVSIRLDDVRRQRTLWQDNTTTGTKAAQISLPVAGAAKATSVVRCFASVLAQLKRQDDKLLSLLSRACARGDGLTSDLKAVTVVWRDLAASATESAFVQGYFARSILLYSSQAATTAQPALLQETRAATQRALKLDPNNGYALGVLPFLAIADGRSRIEAEKIWVDGLKANPSDGNLNISYSNFLAGAGRYRDALPYVLTAVQSDPLRPSFNPESTLANVGRPAEARRSYEERNARFADPALWSNWIREAIFEGLGDVPHVFDAAPAGVSGDRLSCWHDIAAASMEKIHRLAGINRLKECIGSGIVDPRVGVGLMAALGDVDGAFALASDDRLDRSRPGGFLFIPLFNAATRAMRADARFLPLVKERGLWDYWVDTTTHPDLCDTPAEKSFEVCAALRAAQMKK